MSSSDILDVLNIQGSANNGEPSSKRQKLNNSNNNNDHSSSSSSLLGPGATITGDTTAADVKLSGISRELYQLLGENTPPVLLKQQSKFKDKALDRVTPWYWAKFKNNARKDGLLLNHWSKGTDEINTGPYKFEKYNTKGYDIPSFTKEDYEEFLSGGSGPEEEEEGKNEMAWDYEETQYLFNLVKVYDLNWIVVNDRYKYEGRTVEDLKERFYSICQHILIHSNEASSTNMNSNLISNLNYNKTKELERKEYLERLLARTPAEIAEEESLLIEAKKYEIAAKRTISERAQLLKLLDSPISSNTSIEPYLTSQGLTQLYNTLMTTKTKRKQNDNVPENPLTALNEKLKLTPQQVQSQQSQQHAASHAAAQIAQPSSTSGGAMSSSQTPHAQRKVNPLTTLLSKNLTRKEEQQYGIQTHTEKLTPGVYLRSTRIPQSKASVQTKIVASLAELGIGSKPTMPTAMVMSRYEDLVKNLGLVLELKKQADKLDAGR